MRHIAPAIVALAMVAGAPIAVLGDGIWSGGGLIGNDGVANKNAVGVNGITAVAASGGCVSGSVDLSTTCGVLTFTAMGIL